MLTVKTTTYHNGYFLEVSAVELWAFEDPEVSKARDIHAVGWLYCLLLGAAFILLQ